ncbi:hypothetical protein BABINDRAFT_42422 [Babjeviella inositovora NRRL Y-12698]|uniref:Ca3427-like PBP 2 domain-containing protein n=1 Tax=Babjeviella inositovora NRRL Y-12698 TaxID=984486 RepID=A0A1E3QHB4_9ASCO|nr:uncharacterized protein BABINDRAFT_42422 [Babjeviella inositovora NRRL Y-12698]ODQ76988.1 hypothetical protein BABINDRAFT_42422 [Babjeviella inositovora NRRL Y-12698]
MSFRVGYVPEHFSTPIQFAQTHQYFAQQGLTVELVPFPSGSGHLIQCLGEKTIDIAIGLTEAFIAGTAKGNDTYKTVGTYVSSPLCWAISTGAARAELTRALQLQGKKIGVSRIGSGSYVMSFVLALQSQFSTPYYAGFPICHTFKHLRDSVNLVSTEVEHSDAFMWEYFTSKKYYDSGEIKQIGVIYTPWPSWVITARSDVVDTQKEALRGFLKALQQGVTHFQEHQEEAIEYIHQNLDYSEKDARAWIKTVRFSENVGAVDWEAVVTKTAQVLTTAGVLTDSKEVTQERLEAGVLRAGV